MHNVDCFYNQIKKNHEIMLNTFSQSLIIWEPAIETWAQDMNRGQERTVEPGELNSSPTLEIIL